MAAPTEVTIHNLSGQWVMNKSLSDDMNPLMELQGVPWLVRKAAAMMNVTARLTQTTDAATGTGSITIETVATGGFKGETKTYKLDGSEMRSESKFGVTHVRARWLNLSERDQPRSMGGDGVALDPYLTEDWIEEPCEKLEGKPGYVQVYIVQEGGEGTAEQVFGFCMIDGKRYHVQKTVATKDNKTVKVRAVYEWKGQ
ncbi:hypothetical protein PG993_000577 [Apiospora rasikravindrae]|uniref:Uncharacterized protein n=1 Tax=Apiospora rasikravindrae TaxID=990691 RepID=A0ABR1U8Y5_9PEZI